METTKAEIRMISWMINVVFLQVFSAIVYWYYSSGKKELCQFYRWMMIANMIAMAIVTPLFVFTNIFPTVYAYQQDTGYSIAATIINFGAEYMPFNHFITMFVAVQCFTVHSTINITRIIYEYNYSINNDNGAETAKKYVGIVALVFTVFYTLLISATDTRIYLGIIILSVLDYIFHTFQAVLYCIKLRNHELSEDSKYKLKCKAGVFAIICHCLSIIPILLSIPGGAHVYFAPVYVFFIFQNIGWTTVSWNTHSQIKQIPPSPPSAERRNVEITISENI